MKRRRRVLLLLIFLMLACPLLAVFVLVNGGEPPRSLTPVTPILLPTDGDSLITLPAETDTAATPDVVPVFATHAAISTQFAATTTALAPVAEHDEFR